MNKKKVTNTSEQFHYDKFLAKFEEICLKLIDEN